MKKWKPSNGEEAVRAWDIAANLEIIYKYGSRREYERRLLDPDIRRMIEWAAIHPRPSPLDARRLGYVVQNNGIRPFKGREKGV